MYFHLHMCECVCVYVLVYAAIWNQSNGYAKDITGLSRASNRSHVILEYLIRYDHSNAYNYHGQGHGQHHAHKSGWNGTWDRNVHSICMRKRTKYAWDMRIILDLLWLLWCIHFSLARGLPSTSLFFLPFWLFFFFCVNRWCHAS